MLGARFVVDTETRLWAIGNRRMGDRQVLYCTGLQTTNMYQAILGIHTTKKSYEHSDVTSMID